MSESGEIDETADGLTGAFQSALVFVQGDTVCPSFPDGVTLISTMELFFLSGGPLGRIQPVTFQNRVCQISVCGAFVAFDTTSTGDYDAIYTTIFQAPPGTFWTVSPPGCPFTSPDQTAFSCTFDIAFTLI